MNDQSLPDLSIVMKSAGEIGSGIACRLYRSNFKKIILLDIERPLAVRRNVSFCEAVYDGEKTVEGITAVKINDAADVPRIWEQGKIPILVDPEGLYIQQKSPQVVVDAILAKRNIGTTMTDASLVIALGPGFDTQRDAHCIIETNRGHNLGRLIRKGSAEPNTGIPGMIGNETLRRVLRSPAEGMFLTDQKIGNSVIKGDVIGKVGEHSVKAEIDGMIRGLIRAETLVTKKLKIGDIDPRNKLEYCDTISEKARAIGGSVLEAILEFYNR